MNSCHFCQGEIDLATRRCRRCGLIQPKSSVDAPAQTAVVGTPSTSCPTCGESLPASARFCGHCGQILHLPSTIGAEYQESTAAARQKVTSATNETDKLLERVRQGSKAEQAEILQGLLRCAQASRHQDDWNAYAVALLFADRSEEAIRIFTSLVKAYPSVATYRVSLATAYSQTGQFALARYHLQYLIEHGSTEESRQIGKQQLANLDRQLGKSEENQSFNQLQLAALREQITSGTPTAEDYARLGRLILQMNLHRFENTSLNEAISVLEKGHTTFPQAREILELLATCYLRTDDDRLEEILKALEKVAPDSPVLQATAQVWSMDQADVDRYQQTMWKRACDLTEMAHSQDPQLQKAAIEELRQMVTRFPSNFNYRMLYAFALEAGGYKAEAIAQAEIVAKDAEKEKAHSIHFNLGQIFWWCGDRVRGRQHLILAFRYAQNAQEVYDTLQVMEVFSGKKGKLSPEEITAFLLGTD